MTSPARDDRTACPDETNASERARRLVQASHEHVDRAGKLIEETAQRIEEATQRLERSATRLLSRRGQTNDTRSMPCEVIAARAIHPGLYNGEGSVPSPDYRPPADFLALPLAKVPQTPRKAPQLATDVLVPDDLASLRRLLRATARTVSALPLEAIEDLLLAVHEVIINGALRGATRVSVTLWANLAQIVVQVVDDGPRGVDPLDGYRSPDLEGARSLWAGRQLVDDLIVDTPHDGGCRILLIKS